MITLLMALFMVLFSISSVNTAKFVTLQRSLQDAFSGRILPGGRALQESGGDTQSPKVAATPPSTNPAVTSDGAGKASAKAAAAAAKVEQKDFKALKARVDAYVGKHGLASKVTTIVTPDGLVIRLLTDKLLFGSGSATVQPEGRGLLAQVGTLLRAENQHVIRVRGFTDPVPIHTAAFPSNWELSAGRAASVVRAFAGAGVAPERLEAAGRASLDPLTSNATASGRARNRRVEVLLPRVATGDAAAAAEKATAGASAVRTQLRSGRSQMKGKLKFIIPIVVLLVLGGVYKFVLAKPAAVAKPKVDGEVYVLPKDFLVNLTDGKFAKLGVGLVFDEGFAAAPAKAAEGAAAPPTGYGVLPQEAVVRDIVTDVVTDSSAKDLTSRKGREDIKTKILKRLKAQTDVKVHEVLLTDVAVQ